MAKMTKKGRSFVSDEISHLIKDGPSKGPQKGKKMPQKQAVAVALDVARRKGFKSAPNPKEEDMSIFDSIVKQESASLFDDIVEASNPTKSAFDDIVEASNPAKSVFDDIVESKAGKPSGDNWDDRVARTLTLTEELTEIRGSVKKNS